MPKLTSSNTFLVGLKCFWIGNWLQKWIKMLKYSLKSTLLKVHENLVESLKSGLLSPSLSYQYSEDLQIVVVFMLAWVPILRHCVPDISYKTLVAVSKYTHFLL